MSLVLRGLGRAVTNALGALAFFGLGRWPQVTPPVVTDADVADIFVVTRAFEHTVRVEDQTVYAFTT